VRQGAAAAARVCDEVPDVDSDSVTLQAGAQQLGRLPVQLHVQRVPVQHVSCSRGRSVSCWIQELRIAGTCQTAARLTHFVVSAAPPA